MNSIKSHCITLLTWPLKMLKNLFFGLFFFFLKIWSEIWGCVLYTGAHYTRVNTVFNMLNDNLNIFREKLLEPSIAF